MTDDKKIVGIGGYARSGKNLFAAIAQNILLKHGVKSKILSLAEELKNNLNNLVGKRVFDFFTEDPLKKKLARPLMVAYGNFMRDISNGTYWTHVLEKKIYSMRDFSGVIFITDIRYNTQEKDECAWLLNKMKGNLIHLEKYNINTKNKAVNSNLKKIFNDPPNNTELINDPMVKNVATINVEWMEVNSFPLISNAYLNNIVNDALIKLNLINNI